MNLFKNKTVEPPYPKAEEPRVKEVVGKRTDFTTYEGSVGGLEISGNDQYEGDTIFITHRVGGRRMPHGRIHIELSDVDDFVRILTSVRDNMKSNNKESDNA